jgi:hypothetical protein
MFIERYERDVRFPNEPGITWIFGFLSKEKPKDQPSGLNLELIRQLSLHAARDCDRRVRLPITLGY